MKQYISAVLINALLLQLAGCYSQKAITYQEFYKSKNIDEAIIITIDSNSIKLRTDSLKNNYVKWNTTEDSITVWTTRYFHEQRYKKVVSDTVNLHRTEIDKVYINEYDGTKTLIVLAISAIAVVVGGIAFRNNFKPFSK